MSITKRAAVLMAAAGIVLATGTGAFADGGGGYPGYHGGLIDADVNANVLGLLDLGLDLNVGGGRHYGHYREPMRNIPPYY